MAMASGHSCFPPFEHFLWDHWDYSKTSLPNPNNYCDRMMWDRGLYGKPKHTFIHEPIDKILNVCRGGGIHLGGGWCKSKDYFTVTKCTFHPPCGPYTGTGICTKIVLRCCNGFPVDIKE